MAKTRQNTRFLMLDRQPQWILQPQLQPPAWFLQLVQSHVPASSGHFAAQMLWQRGIQDRRVMGKRGDRSPI